MLAKAIKHVIHNPEQLSENVVGAARGALIQFGRLTHPLRTLPHFLIIGAQKSGTTSLYKYLIQHPQVVPAYTKEIHYFSTPNRFGRGPAWYKAHFPMAWALGEKITGEASPSYLLHPLAPQRAHALVPQAKIIVILRDPVARAISHYEHMRRYRHEPLSLADAIAQEEARLAGITERLAADPAAHDIGYFRHSYLTRGRYAEQLERWFAHFPRQQCLILPSERFYASPEPVMQMVFSFLGLRPWEPPANLFKQFNAGDYAREETAAIAQELRAYFQPHNKHLAALLGEDFGWDKEL